MTQQEYEAALVEAIADTERAKLKIEALRLQVAGTGLVEVIKDADAARLHERLYIAAKCIETAQLWIANAKDGD